MLEHELRRRGLSAQEAQAAARRRFDGVDLANEIQRDPRSFTSLE